LPLLQQFTIGLVVAMLHQKENVMPNMPHTTTKINLPLSKKIWSWFCKWK